VKILLLAVVAIATGSPSSTAAVENGPIAYSTGDAIFVLGDGAETPITGTSGGSWPAWSPDGTEIAYTSIRRDGLFVMNADGTGARRVTRSPTIDLQPAWSPDGKHLAFARTVPGFNTEIYVVGVDGKGLRRLTKNHGQDAEPSWAPNGKRIAWSFSGTRVGSTSGIYTMNPDGAAKRFRGAGIAPDWSPDGQRFVFALDGDLWTSLVTGAEREPLATAPAVDARPQWSPDGTQIAFLSSQGSPTDQYRLWRIDVGGTNRRLLTPARDTVSSFSWARRT
jgi:Tol biopolymer transport system component